MKNNTKNVAVNTANANVTNTIVDARWNFKGNIKVGNIATWSTLPGDGEFNSKYGVVKGTCTGCCAHCGHSVNGKRPPCYVFKSHRYPSVVDGQARNTLSIRNNPELAFQQLSNALSRKRKPVLAARFDQSGEIENNIQHTGMIGVAKDHENTPFYVYTKKSEVVIPNLLNGIVPKNFFHLISIWHEQGIEDYLSVKHLPNVKAFVYCDKNSDPINGWGPEEYAAHGLEIQTFCKAYGLDGKMNHNITCDVCKKCFVRKSTMKVIGCWNH